MGSRRVAVKNNCGIPRAYFLFVEAATISGNDGSNFQVVYQTRSSTPPGGRADFVVNSDLYAVAGTSGGRGLSANATLNVTNTVPVKVCGGSGNSGTSLAVQGAGPVLSFNSGARAENCNQNGAFSIRSDGSVGGDESQFIGVGLSDPNGGGYIIPISVFRPQASTEYNITPRNNKCYIAWGTYTPGQIVNVQSLEMPCQISFEGRAETSAVVEHTPDGMWSVKYA